MRQLLRRLFNLAAVLSVVFVSMTVVLWVRSFWVGDMVVLSGATNVYEIDSLSGRVSYCVATSDPWPIIPTPIIKWTHWSDPTPIAIIRFLGTGAGGAALWESNAYPTNPRSSYGVLGIWGSPGPMHQGSAPWPVVCLCLAVPAMARVLIRRRPPPGSCRQCGYDLRATPGRCPECGAVPTK